MKKIIVILLLAFNFLWNQTVKAQKITKIEFIYLPWDYHTLGRLSEEDVRNFEIKQKSFYSISDTIVINDFIRSMSIFYLRRFDELQTIEPRMIIDIFLEKSKKTILLDRDQSIRYMNIFYFKNFELSKWIHDNIPRK